MKTYFIYFTTLLWGALSYFSLSAQDSISHPPIQTGQLFSTQTYFLDEVLISSQLPAEQSVLHFYKSSQLNRTEDVLARLPGISLIRRGNYAQDPVLRGMAANRIQVTIDGMQIFGACTDRMDPVTSYVEPNNLQGIHLAKGATGLENGSTVGGSLDLQLKKAQTGGTNSWQGNIGGGYQSAAKQAQGQLSLGYRGKRLGIRINGIYRKADDYRAGGGEIIPYSGFEKINYSLAATYKLSESEQLMFDFLGDDGWNIGYPALPMDVAYAKAKIMGLSYIKKFDSPWFLRLEAKAYGNLIDHAMDDTQREDVVMHMDMPGYTRTAGAYVKSKLLLGGKHVIHAKADYFYSFAHAEMTMYPDGERPMFMLTWPDVARQVAGLNLNHSLRLNSRLKLATGMRLEYAHSTVQSELGLRQMEIFGFGYPGSDSRLLANLNSTLNITSNDKLSWEVGLAYGERLPSVSEQFGYYLYNAYDGYDYLGNPNLAKEKALQWEGGAHIHLSGIELSAKLFAYGFDDYILGLQDSSLSAMTPGANGVKIYQSVGKAFMAGGEIQGLWKMATHFHWVLNAQYTYGQEERGYALPLIPPLQGQLALRYQKGNSQFQAEAEGAAAQNRLHPEFGESSTPAYLIFNLRLTQMIPLGKEQALKLSGGVENLFDQNYRNHLDWGQIPRQGRNVYVTLGWEFR